MIVLAFWTFSVTKTCKLAETIIVNVFCHFSPSFWVCVRPFFGPFSIIYEMNTENSSVCVILMMPWPEKNNFSGVGAPKNAKKNFSHFWVLFDVDFAMKAKKRGCAYQFGDMGLAKIWSKRVGNFGPCNLRPKYLKTGGVYPFFTTCSMRPEGGPLGQAAKPRPKGCGPLPLSRGQATLHFWAVGGAMLSLTPKNHI